mgnify:CR=1 FL=1
MTQAGRAPPGGILRRRAVFHVQPAEPAAFDEARRQRVAAFIDAAKHTLWLQNERYQDQVIIERLVRAARRGVKIHILSKKPHSLKPDKLIEGVGGLRILQDVGAKVHTLKHLKLHAKMLLADSRHAIVGSINVPIIYFSVRWWNTLHQGATVSMTAAPKMASTMLSAMLLMTLAFWAYAFAVVFTRARAIATPLVAFWPAGIVPGGGSGRIAAQPGAAVIVEFRRFLARNADRPAFDDVGQLDQPGEGRADWPDLLLDHRFIAVSDRPGQAVLHRWRASTSRRRLDRRGRRTHPQAGTAAAIGEPW